jgi:hypothetical protein
MNSKANMNSQVGNCLALGIVECEPFVMIRNQETPSEDIGVHRPEPVTILVFSSLISLVSTIEPSPLVTPLKNETHLFPSSLPFKAVSNLFSILVPPTVDPLSSAISLVYLSSPPTGRKRSRISLKSASFSARSARRVRRV